MITARMEATGNIPTHDYVSVNKIARLTHIAVTILAAAATTALVISAIVAPCIALTVVAVVAGLALTILFSAKAILILKPYLPQTLQNTVNKVQGFISDLMACGVLGILFPLDMEKYSVAPEELQKDKPLIVFVNGFLGNSNNFAYVAYRLKKAGYSNLAYVNVGNPLEKIEDKASVVANKIKAYQQQNPQIILVSHSMGGLISKQVAVRNPEAISQIVTYCTPHDGTSAAHIAPVGCGKQMQPSSEYVTGLNHAFNKLEKKPEVLAFYSEDDVVVSGKSAQEVDGCKKKTPNGIGHVGCLFSDELADEVVRFVSHPANGHQSENV